MRWLAVTVGILVTPYAWLVAASAIYLTGMERIQMFRFPYLQWIAAARWWNYSPWVALWVCLSALIPTLTIIALWQVLFVQKRPGWSLYGKTGWATPKDMLATGWDLRKRL